jgi:hypothetical protein
VCRTVVVDEVGHADAEEGRIEAGVEACNTLALDDAARCIEGRRLSALGFDLGAGGEGDERVAGGVLAARVERSTGRIRQGHGQQSPTSASKRMRDIVALLGCRALGHRGSRLGKLVLRLFLCRRHDLGVAGDHERRRRRVSQ